VAKYSETLTEDVMAPRNGGAIGMPPSCNDSSSIGYLSYVPHIYMHKYLIYIYDIVITIKFANTPSDKCRCKKNSFVVFALVGFALDDGVMIGNEGNGKACVFAELTYS
jgi:hypothetical protein